MIAYLGPVGTFTEKAVRTLFPLVDASQRQPMISVPAVLDAVAKNIVTIGVVPMENSIQGTVHVTIDGLLAHPGLEIVKEVVLRIEQHLMVCKGTDWTQVTEVWSHPQALAQCRGFIQGHGFKEIQYDSTAGAAFALSQSGRDDVAVIGPQQAAIEHNLTVVKSNIADVTENWTRFAVIRRVEVSGRVIGGEESSEAYADKKTMLVVTPYNNFPGVLSSILNVFSTFGLNLCWIESRPTRQRLGTYQFFVEIQTGIEDESLRRAIRVLEAYGHTTHLLGSYGSASETENDANRNP